jgi:NAD(P)H-nitrite reductase large subunit
MVGIQTGWRILAGGFVSGLKPRLANLIATALNDDEAPALTDKVIDWYQKAGKAKRLGRIIDEVGLERFIEELGLPAM